MRALAATLRPALLGAWLLQAMAAFAQQVARVDEPPPDLRPLPAQVHGRAVAQPDGSLLRQWPGTYFEAAFAGEAAYFHVGDGDVTLRVAVDGGEPVALVKPAPGLYRVGGLGRGEHHLRLTVASESQGGPTAFGGFLAEAGTRPVAVERRSRQIEFIGDSHTVGYGNTSLRQACTTDEVWATTDTSVGVPALVAARFGADYEAQAISGRGVVRNYGGLAADTLPQAYPFALLEHGRRADDAGWHPQAIAIALGTNDFSTPLQPGEPWTTREQLRTAYEDGFVAFVEALRRRQPQAYVVIWIAAADGSEVQSAVAGVAARLRAAGLERLGFVPVTGLAMSGCHHHPSVADDRRIAEALTRHLQAQAALGPAP
jgi:lysophospholipase L1-like esterase